MKEIINRIAELRKNIETAKLTDVIEISVELIRIESLLKAINYTHSCEELCDVCNNNQVLETEDGYTAD